MRWQTKRIEEVLRPVPRIFKVAINPQGSEITTEQIVYAIEGVSDRIYVRGFTTERRELTSDDCEVEMIEVTSEYSDGGDSPETLNILARAEITVELIRAGYEKVVRSLDPYF